MPWIGSGVRNRILPSATQSQPTILLTCRQRDEAALTKERVMSLKIRLPVFIALLAVAACSDTKKPQTQEQSPLVVVSKPLVKDVVEFDDFTGRFEAMQTVEIRTRVNGAIVSSVFKEGAIVHEGDLLFTIDKRPYQMAVDQAEASALSAESRMKFAEGDLERAQSLNRTGNVSEQILEQRRQAFSTAKADLNGANAALARARLNLEWTEIRAPISGRVGRKLISEGNLVKADDSMLTTVVSTDPIHFYFDMSESAYLAYLQRFKEHGGLANDRNEAWVAIAGEKEPTRIAHLEFFDNHIDAASGTMRVRAVVANPDNSLQAGLFGTIRLAGSPAFQGVLIPDQAIGTDQDRRLVWVVGEDMIVTARDVQPGP